MFAAEFIIRIIVEGAYVDLNSDIRINRTNATMSLQSDAVFSAIKERVAADQDKAKSINAVFLYKITKNGIVVKDWSEFSTSPIC